MVSLVAQKEKILLSCYKVLFVLQNHFYPFSHLKLLGLVFLSLSYLLSPEIREQMYLETHFQYEFSFFGCFGQLGLQSKKNPNYHKYASFFMLSWGKSNFIFFKYPSLPLTTFRDIFHAYICSALITIEIPAFTVQPILWKWYFVNKIVLTYCEKKLF